MVYDTVQISAFRLSCEPCLALYHVQIMSFLIVILLVCVTILIIKYAKIKTHIGKLKELNHVTDEMTSGNLDIRCTIKGNDEIAELGRSLNILIQTIKVSYDTLESRVKDRTAALNTIIDSNPAGIILVDAQAQTIVRANQAACRMMGYSVDQVLNMNCHEAFCNNEIGCPILAAGQLTDYAEHDLIKADGSTLPILKSVVVLSIGGRKHLLETFTDISQQHNTAYALRDNLLFMQTLMDTIPNPIYYKDSNGIYLGCNKSFFNEIIGSATVDFVDLLPDDFAALEQEKDDEVVRDKLTLQYEGRVKCPDGILRDYNFNKAVFADSNGNVAGIVGVMQDITERKNMERQLLQIRSAIDDASDAIVITDVAGISLYCNRAFEMLSGYRITSLNNLRLSSLFLENEQAEGFLDCIGNGESWQGELTVVTRNGFKIPVHLRGTAVLSELYNIEGMTFILSDLRQQKKQEHHQQMIEAQLRQAQKMESIGQLAAGVAHEINTPVQFIGDNTRFIQDSFVDMGVLYQEYDKLLKAALEQSVVPELSRAVEKMKNDLDVEYLREEIPKAIQQSLDGIKRIAEIVQAMKEFSHPGGGDKSAVDINRAISSTITVARNEWKYVAEVDTEFDEDLGLVLCLPGEFNQVILNILVNAAHAIEDHIEQQPDGKGHIRITTSRKDQWAEIRISDTGGGIPEHAQERIFDPFFTTKDVGRGTGQGLYIAYDVIVNKHVGKLTFETEPGKGTTFIIRLPIEGT